MRIQLTPGDEVDVTQARALHFGLRSKVMVANKAYELDELIFAIRRRKGSALIPLKSNRACFRWYDRSQHARETELSN